MMAEPKRQFLSLSVLMAALLVSVLTSAASAQGTDVYVSELFYNADGQAEGHEFIELHNRGPGPVDVSGWSLVDGVSFTLPAGTILGPDERLAVAANGVDYEAVWGVTTPFEFSGSLSNGGETITIVDDLGQIVESFTYDDLLPWPSSADGDGDSLVRVDPDISGDVAASWIDGTPTPRAVDQPNITVLFSVERGWYSSGQTVTLSSPIPGATIRYNTSGSGNADLSYSGPISMSPSGVQVIQASAQLGGAVSPVVTHTYVFQPDTGVPIVAVWANGRSVAPGQSESTLSFEFIPPPSTGLSAVGVDAGLRASAGGVSSGQSEKIFFRGAYGAATLNADLFSDNFYGIEAKPEIDQLFLRSQHLDGTHLRQIIAHDSLLALGQISPHGRFVRVWQYGWDSGVRHLQERPEGGFLEAYTGIAKDQWIAASNAAEGYPIEVMGAPYNSWAEANRQLDVEAIIDYQLVQWQAKVSDFGPLWNWRIAGPANLALADGEDYRFRFFNWDMDLGYMNQYYGNGHPTNWGFAGYGSPNYVLHEIDHFDEFRLLASDRIVCAHFDNGPLTVGAMIPRVQNRQAELLAAGGWDQSSFVNSLTTWLGDRNSWLIDEYRSDGADQTTYGNQGAAPPSNFIGPLLGDRDPLQITTTNGVLSISGSGGHPVWYRLDGGDPRTPTGQLDAAAIAYDGPVTLPAGRHRITARSFDASRFDPVDQWSPACNVAPATDIAVPGDPGASPGEGLVINEIHYNPPTIEPEDGDQFEFIELLNTSAAPINMGEFAFTSGIEWVGPLPTMSVAAQDSVVLASNAAAFESRYGFAPDGEYGGRLDDGGETLTLVDAVGVVIDEVTYNDAEPWPTQADGEGPSLALIDPQSENALAESWALSGADGGTPGTENDTFVRGDVDCSGDANVVDALLVAQFSAGNRTNARCPLDDPTNQLNARAGDLNIDEQTTIVDALLIAQCSVGIDNGWCAPEE